MIARIARLYRLGLVTGILFILGVTPSFAQTNLATVRGHVTDTGGAVVPNVAVVLSSVATNVTRSTTSNSDGDYEFPYLVPGTYRITCTASGFETFVADDVAIVGDETRRVDMQMKVGSTQTQVVVTSGQSVIATENAQISAGFTQKIYKDSPVSTQVFPEAQMVFLPQVQSEQGGLRAYHCRSAANPG
jgi:hypothetical protein